MKAAVPALISLTSLMACTESSMETASIQLSAGDDYTVISEDGTYATVTLPETGGTSTVNVICTESWTLYEEVSGSWFTYTVEDNTITISAEEKVADYSRSGMLRVSNGERSWAYIKVMQEGSEEADVYLDAESAEFPELGGSRTFSVTSNKEWTVTGHEDSEWIEISDITDSTFTVSVLRNMDPEERNIELTVTAGTEINNSSALLAVTQAPWTEATLTVPQTEMTMPDTDGNAVLTVETNRHWNATTSTQWLSVSVQGDSIIVNSTATAAGLSGTIEVTTTDEGETPVALTINVVTDSDPMILEYTITDTESTPSIPVSSPANVYVDWGDGTGDVMYASGSGAFSRPEHQYASAGTYTVRIYGETSALMTGEEKTGTAITAIESWGDLGFTSMNGGMRYAAIRSIPENSGEALKNVTNFNNAFANCTNLESIPGRLFAGTQVRTLSAVFSGCTSLKEIPADLFEGAENVTSVTAMFMFCSSLETIPDRLFSPLVNLQSGINLFAECTSLKEIPENLFDGCSNLTRLTGTFRTSAITTVPEGLFADLTELTDVMEIFYFCESLESVPAGLFDNNRKLTSVFGLFNGCSSLTGESPYTVIDGSNIHLYERAEHPEEFSTITTYSTCFTGCTDLDDYDSIPSDWKSASEW